MPVEKAIDFKVEDLTAFETVISTFEIIAASAMQKVRGFVLANREFHADLNVVFREVRAAYHSQLKKIERRKKLLGAVMPAGFFKASRTIYVYLSANTGLYGSIITKTFETFLGEIKKTKPDEIAIIGKVGEALFRTYHPQEGFTYFDFPDAKISEDALKHISKYLAQFGEVVVFHGSFKSILTQIPVYYSVSGGARSSETDSTTLADKYRFEPEIKDIFIFFETEIFASLLEQVFHESRLAKLASRLVLLDSASSNIDKYLGRAIYSEQKARHREFNRKLTNTYSAFALWK